MAGRLYVGTSGWNYAEWKEGFYAGVRRKDWLPHYATRFDAVEVNATFYQLQKKPTFEGWRDATPEGFRFAIKGNRYLSHRKRLADPEPSLALERARACGLGAKLAVVLWQTPRDLPFDLGRLRAFADALAGWPGPRQVLEFRSEGWFVPAVADLLSERGLANCQSDAADWPLWDAVTTDLVYLRLHGHEATYASAYSAAQLRGWAAKISRWRAEGRDVHAYFDNTAAGAAPHDAARLLAMAE